MVDFGFVWSLLSLPGLLVFILTLLVVFILTRKDGNLPPGPTPLPVIGNLLLFAGKNFLEVMERLRSKYGDIVCLKIGVERTIVINGYENIHEAFVKQADDFSDRDESSLQAQIRQGHGVLFSSGNLWKNTRTFTLKSLRDLGFGKRNLESKIMEEIECFVQEIEKTNGQEFCVDRMVQISVCNIICCIINGQRYEYNDETLKTLLSLMDENVRLSTPLSSAFLPYFRYLPFDPFKTNKRKANAAKSMDFQSNIVEMHKKNFCTSAPNDLIDAFILESKSNTSSIFSDSGIVSVIFDLYVAGTETTSNTIRWAIALVLHYPEVQEKLHQEISSTTGSSRKPTINDKPQMPYFQAFIQEVLRFSNIVPLALPHFATNDIAFKGFIIPKGSRILPNLQSVLQDPVCFPDPEEFNPSRFIDENGLFIHEPKVIPFGIGRRVCLGESLAKMELFLYLATLFQRFEFIPGEELPCLKGVLGIVKCPRPFSFKARSRALDKL